VSGILSALGLFAATEPTEFRIGSDSFNYLKGFNTP